MPAWGRRQSYPAVVWTTTLLVGVFSLTTWLRQYIPDREPNPIIVQRGQFMANASQQRIHWRSLDDDPFAEARRTDRLIVLVVGCAWSWQARAFDHNVLMETEVAERLNREFIPVRIDAFVKPEWESGPFPLGSAESGTDPGWYVLIMRPDGQPLELLTRQDYRQRIDSQLLQSMLSKAQGLKRRASADAETDFSRRARFEASYLVGEPGASGGDLPRYASGVAANVSSDRMFTEGGAFRWHPWEWRFLLSAGLASRAEPGLRSVLSSSMVDWLYGGVFRTDSDLGPTGVRFEKLAIENADMSLVLALFASESGDPGLKSIAEQTFDAVFDQFVTAEEVYGYSYTEAETQGRNPRYSVRPKIIGDNFRGEQSQLQTRLGLRLQSNPSMVVQVRNLSDFSEQRGWYTRVFQKLRDVLKGPEPVVAGTDLANNVCELSARLIESARILGDKKRLQKALALYRRTLDYKVGQDGIRHSVKPTPDMVAFLGDYTAFADASFQKFLATGDTAALLTGAKVLARARSLFQRDREGVVSTIPLERALPEAPWVALPNVIDGSQGSLVGAYSRLAEDYSLVLGDQVAGKNWRETALTTVAQYSELTKKLNFRLGALAHAMVRVTKDEVVVIVGPNCVQESLDLAPKLGDVLVVPALGFVRKDVQAKGPGYYVCHQNVIQGPFNVDEAIAAIKSPP